MPDAPRPPVPRPRADGTASLGASCVAWGRGGARRGLLIAGPEGASSGAGKSGLAAHLVAMGCDLVADDLCLLARAGAAVTAAPPPGRDPAGPTMELRGMGLATVPLAAPVPVAGMLLLAPSAARLPEPERTGLLGVAVPLLRHPYRFDAAAKALLWLRHGR
jgi:HPr kinase/phosphorylase